MYIASMGLIGEKPVEIVKERTRFEALCQLAERLPLLDTRQLRILGTVGFVQLKAEIHAVEYAQIQRAH